MAAMEERLNSNFMRVHRSYIVNLKKILSIEDNSILIENKVIPISKTYQDKLFKKLDII
jgi:DNA-binding LytR/AlgR family response regulator